MKKKQTKPLEEPLRSIEGEEISPAQLEVLKQIKLQAEQEYKNKKTTLH